MLDGEDRKWHQPHPQSKSRGQCWTQSECWLPESHSLSQDYTHQTAGARSPIWEQHRVTPELSTSLRRAAMPNTQIGSGPERLPSHWIYQLIWLQEMLSSAKSIAAVSGIFSSWVTKSLEMCQAFQRIGFGVYVMATQWVMESISHLAACKSNICCPLYIPSVLYVSPFMSLGLLRYSPDTPTFPHFTSGILPPRKVLKNDAIGTAEVRARVCKPAVKYSSQVRESPLQQLQTGILGKQEHSSSTDVLKIPIQEKRKLIAQKQLCWS